jgi:septum formation protein
MIKTDLPVFLASASPRRKKLLEQLGIDFSVVAVDINENPLKNERPHRMVLRLSLEKLNEAKEKIKKGIIITADTTVVLNGKIIGKPDNKKDAENILKKLSGKTHLVYTGIAVCNTAKNKILTGFEKTFVTFRKLGDKEIKDYVLTESPLDKAGAYGIQDDFGAVFVKKINGCYYNVVGLPLPKLYEILQKAL